MSRGYSPQPTMDRNHWKTAPTRHLSCPAASRFPGMLTDGTPRPRVACKQSRSAKAWTASRWRFTSGRLRMPAGTCAAFCNWYDNLNRATQVKDAAGNFTTVVFDAGGNLQALVDQ